MKTTTYASAKLDRPRVYTLVTADRCETCIRWLPYKNQAFGKCGKKAWRTPSTDWCRFHTRETCDNG